MSTPPSEYHFPLALNTAEIDTPFSRTTFKAAAKSITNYREKIEKTAKAVNKMADYAKSIIPYIFSITFH